MTVLRDPLPGAGLVPFLIDWAGRLTQPRLRRKAAVLSIYGANTRTPAQYGKTLRALGVELPVAAGPAPVLIAQLRTPNGRLELR